MEGVAKHLNMTIPTYVPISPFKDIDAPPVILHPVKFEQTHLDNYKDSKLRKNNTEDSCGDLNSFESSKTQKAIDLQVNAQKLEDLKTSVKNKEGKLGIIEGTQSELEPSSVSNQLLVNDLCTTFGDSQDCPAKLQHEQGDVGGDVRLKNEDLESHPCEYPEVPSKKIKRDDNAAV